MPFRSQMVGVYIVCALAFCGFMKWLRSDRRLLILLLLTSVLAITGVAYRVPGDSRLNDWDGLLGPFFYVVSYGALRYVYKGIYRWEPTYAYLSWYDMEEKRRMNWFDLAVHFLPCLIALAVPVILSELLR